PGPQTRIGDALTQVLQSAGSVPLAGIVLMSDGAENGDTLDEKKLADIASYGVPVHVVGLGSERVVNDVELEQLDLASTAPQGATLSARVGIRHHGAKSVQLKVYDRDVLVATRTVALESETGQTSVSIDVPAGEPGTHELRFVLDPLPEERNTINNA